MKYYNLKRNETDKGIFVKTNSKIDKLCSRMSKLAQQHAKLDRLLVKEFAQLNGISEDEASDIMCSYDFLVDISQYGLTNFCQEQISRENYIKAKDGE